MNAPATHLPGGHTSRGARTTAAAGSSCQPPGGDRRPKVARGWLAFPARQRRSDTQHAHAGGADLHARRFRTGAHHLCAGVDLPPGQTAVDTHAPAAGGGRQERTP